VLGIVGESGSGKSTLLNCHCRQAFSPIDSGEVLFRDGGMSALDDLCRGLRAGAAPC
jgi:ABC-type glutathione transport system ATPase component